MGHEILVDGYNVIKRDASFQSVRERSFEGARHALITQLVNRYRHTPHHVTVVFDGDAPREQTTHQQRIRVIFSRAGETADSVIARLAAQARAEGRDVEMFSDDLEVQHAVKSVGGNAQSASQLTSQLNAPPIHLKRLVRHRQYVRQKYGLDPMQTKDDDVHEQQRLRRGRKR
ncbi:MAG TPA: NYN domain-containing protein [Ktedonobacteraceae bacterium]|nr:NYN domain-containing protein [Ktedonobacteraceae bacterium]